MEKNKDETLGEWFQRAKSQGYSVSLPMYYGIQTAMKEMNMGFKELFELFVKRGIIILTGSVFVYDMRRHTALIPKGLYKCEKCGEYKGKTKAKYLNLEGPIIREPETEITVSCLCDGILCPKCKKNKIHRPVSNSYYVEDNIIEHWPWFTGMMSCYECRKKK